MAAIIDSERLGMHCEFETVDEAQQAIRDCGPEFADVTLEVYGDEIEDESRRERVGTIADRPAIND